MCKYQLFCCASCTCFRIFLCKYQNTMFNCTINLIYQLQLSITIFMSIIIAMFVFVPQFLAPTRQWRYVIFFYYFVWNVYCVPRFWGLQKTPRLTWFIWHECLTLYLVSMSAEDNVLLSFIWQKEVCYRKNWLGESGIVD